MRGNQMDFKDKLNLVWKFLFLAVFTYGVISITCCSSSCSQNQTCSKSAPVVSKCGPECVKACCAK